MTDRGSQLSTADQIKYSEFMKFMQNVSDSETGIESSSDFGAAAAADWVSDFNTQKTSHDDNTDSYNTQFWNRLQDEWKSISSENEQSHQWSSEFNDFHDPYKVNGPPIAFKIFTFF